MLNITPILLVIANMQTVQPVIVKTADMEIDFTPRTPNQMGSFYEARGFPKEMRDVLKKQCFITVGILNTSNKKIWLDLANWKFSAAGKPIHRDHRDVWKKRWQGMGMPLNKQSTFRWTLIPETLDYLPGEHEGGNIVLPFTDKPVSITATFATGEDKQGKKITITTDKLFCAEDAQ
ncbi:MAG: hypothetical protein IMF15_01075 [Proteobacteria bacterium]|nr:hypothetical protein [Pseudomonadota bacterium]